MADLTASDVTIAREKVGRIDGFCKIARLTLAVGDGAKTYPALGIPLPANQWLFGMSKTIHHIPPVMLAGKVYEYDKTNHKLRIWQQGGFTPAGSVAAPVFTGSALDVHNHDLKVMGGAAAGIDEPIGVEGTDTLAKDAATDRTIAGADSATKGGVVGISAGTPAGTNSAPAFTGTPVAAGTLAEFSGAVPATSLTLMVFGE